MKLFVGILLLLILAIIVWLGFEFYSFFSAAENEMQAALIGLFGVTIAAISSHYFSQKREISSRHFPQKVEAYGGLFDLIFEIMKGVRTGSQLEESEMVEKMMVIKRNLMVWGGPEVIKAWNEYEAGAANHDGLDVFNSMEKIFRALRKELGHRDLTVPHGTFVKWLVQASDHQELDKQMKG